MGRRSHQRKQLLDHESDRLELVLVIVHVDADAPPDDVIDDVVLRAPLRQPVFQLLAETSPEIFSHLRNKAKI